MRPSNPQMLILGNPGKKRAPFHYPKGSPEAREYMARLRAMRGAKKNPLTDREASSQMHRGSLAMKIGQKYHAQGMGAHAIHAAAHAQGLYEGVEVTAKSPFMRRQASDQAAASYQSAGEWWPKGGYHLTGRTGNPEKVNGLHIKYSPVNQAYFLMWLDQVLRIFNSKADAEYEMQELLRKSPPPSSPFHRKTNPAFNLPQDLRGALASVMQWAGNWSAKPYAQALLSGDTGYDDVRGCLLYLKSNLARWRGAEASAAKIIIERYIKGGWRGNPCHRNPLEEGAGCPACGGPLGILGSLGNRMHYQCRNCGMQTSTSMKGRRQSSGFKYCSKCGKQQRKLFQGLCKFCVREGNPPAMRGIPSWMANDPNFRQELAAYQKRHGRGPVKITQVNVPTGYPKYMSVYGKAPEIKYDAPAHSNKGRRIHKFGEGGGRPPWLATSVSRGPKFLSFVGGTFKAKDWIYK